MPVLLAFDIGGTNIRLGVSADGNTIDASAEFPTDRQDYDAAMAQFAATAKKLAGGGEIIGAAGGIPGTLIHGKTTIGIAPNLPGWGGRPVVQDMGKMLGAPVFLENDTAVIGLGEASSGAGIGYAIAVYLTVSTGVGGCRIINGRIDESARGFEPGHHIIDIDGELCACGGKGHLEALIGGASLAKQHGKPTEEISDPAVWDMAAYHLAVGLNNLLMLWSPDIFILGGAVMNSLSLEKTQSHLSKLVTIYSGLPPIVRPKLGSRAGFLGGLTMLRSHGLKV